MPQRTWSATQVALLDDGAAAHQGLGGPFQVRTRRLGASILVDVARHPAGRQAILAAGGADALVQLLRSGSTPTQARPQDEEAVSTAAVTTCATLTGLKACERPLQHGTGSLTPCSAALVSSPTT